MATAFSRKHFAKKHFTAGQFGPEGEQSGVITVALRVRGLAVATGAARVNLREYLKVNGGGIATGAARLTGAGGEIAQPNYGGSFTWEHQTRRKVYLSASGFAASFGAAGLTVGQCMETRGSGHSTGQARLTIRQDYTQFDNNFWLMAA
jgi:hypothetical protein